jgi:branched-chain amino acid transport system permease protein
MRRFGPLLASALLVAGLAWLPFHLDGYLLHWAITILMYVSVALAWDMLARTGQASFGQAGFFGLGAYTAGTLSNDFNVDPLWAILMSTIGVALVAALCSALFLRVRGIYFAILTLAFAEVFKVLTNELVGLTGGPMGLTVKPMFGGDTVRSYFFVLILAIACVAGVSRLRGSKLDFGITAIRGGPEVASAFGVPVNAIKIAIFTLGAVVTGIAGGFYAFYTSYINPESVFDTSISVAPVIMCIFGGLYTIVGPILGAVTLTIFQEVLRTYIESGSLVIYGLLLIVGIIFMPQGVWGLARAGWSRMRSTKVGATAPAEAVHAADP